MSHLVHLDFLKLGALSDPSVTRNMLKVYISLLARANNKTMECFPSRDQTVEDTGISHVNDISEATAKLEALGYINKKGQNGKKYVLKVETPSREEVLLRAVGNIDKENGKPLGESHRSDGKTTYEKPLGDPYEKSLGGPLGETPRRNCINKTNKELNNIPPNWMAMSFPKFNKLKDKPNYSDNFERAWKWYRRRCKELESMEGDKLTAFFRWLQLNQKYTKDEIRLGLQIYLEKKRQAKATLAHFSTVLNNHPMFDQFLDEAKEDEPANQKPRQEAEAPERDLSRFTSSASSSNPRQNYFRREEDLRCDPCPS